MSSRPFAPQDFGVIRVRNHRFSKHRKPWSPLLGFLVASCLPVVLLIGLMWWLVNRPQTQLPPRRGE